jgi:hypothetical protein
MSKPARWLNKSANCSNNSHGSVNKILTTDHTDNTDSLFEIFVCG